MAEEANDVHSVQLAAASERGHTQQLGMFDSELMIPSTSLAVLLRNTGFGKDTMLCYGLEENERRSREAERMREQEGGGI